MLRPWSRQALALDTHICTGPHASASAGVRRTRERQQLERDLRLRFLEYLERHRTRRLRAVFGAWRTSHARRALVRAAADEHWKRRCADPEPVGRCCMRHCRVRLGRRIIRYAGTVLFDWREWLVLEQAKGRRVQVGGPCLRNAALCNASGASASNPVRAAR